MHQRSCSCKHTPLQYRTRPSFGNIAAQRRTAPFRSNSQIESAAGAAPGRFETYLANLQSSGSGNGTAPGGTFQSSWTAKEGHENGERGGDYLYQLGRRDYNINVDTGQNNVHLDYLFTGGFLGEKSDIADGSLRRYEFRTYNNIQGEYYIAPLFLEKVAVHVVKNWLIDNGFFDKRVNVPLILGIWGEKGMGKTFQTELTFKKLGMEPIVMSAGELEHEWAGTPGRLIRERYSRAAEVQKVHGKLSCLLINDIDAGLGHHANTQVTVNNQIVVGTLMNLCDDPNCVSTGGAWREQRISRIPIIVTGNDFSRMFAPLIRDGRMDKFYWKPTFEDLLSIVFQMYKDDGITPEDIAKLLAHFSGQPLDFFGALRASTYDNQIREWIVKDVVGEEITFENANMAELSKRLLKKKTLPQFEPVQLTLDLLIKEGERLAEQQQLVNDIRLSNEYLKKQRGGGSIIGLQG